MGQKWQKLQIQELLNEVYPKGQFFGKFIIFGAFGKMSFDIVNDNILNRIFGKRATL